MNLRQHLKDRHMNVEKYSSVWIDEEEGVATFGLYNLSGQLVGYQQYKPFATKDHKLEKEPRNMKYFTHATLEGKTKAAVVFGLETVNMMEDKFVFLTEGIFDVVRLHNYGLSAIAVLCNNPDHLDSFLSALPAKTVAVCDNNAAGKKLAKHADVSFTVPTVDLGDMTDEELNSFVYSMLRALKHPGASA